MEPSPKREVRERFRLLEVEHVDDRFGFQHAVSEGLCAESKWLPARFLYDARGSELFEDICGLPEYYPTECERALLASRVAEIAALFASSATLVELGSGSSDKTRLLLAAFLERHGAPLHYCAIDISRSALEESAPMLLETFPGLDLTAVSGRYSQGLKALEGQVEPRLLLWLGSSMGNLDRGEAARFLSEVAGDCAPEDRLLIGIDLRKDRRILERAYDDLQGVTAAFNLNMLTRINRELGGHFDLGNFEHRAQWNEEPGRVEMHLVSKKAQRVSVDALGLEVDFRRGEAIHTESSYKYSRSEIDTLAEHSGWAVEQCWLDPKGYFSLNLLAPYGA